MWKSKQFKLPKRKADTHKGDYGRVLIVAGSSGMTGAGVLASRAALRSGAGLVYLAVPKELVNHVDALTPEVITLPFEKISTIKPTSVVIGPGLGNNPLTKKMLGELVRLPIPLVIDADALNVLAETPMLLARVKAELILTPHPGEMARLLQVKVSEVQKDRLKTAKAAAKKFRGIVVLKGHQTVVVGTTGEVYLNKTGNPGMATAGSGDVLAGMIGSLAGQGLPTWEAAVCGAYFHGKAGDLAAKDKGEYGLIASDIVENIPYAL